MFFRLKEFHPKRIKLIHVFLGLLYLQLVTSDDGVDEVIGFAALFVSNDIDYLIKLLFRDHNNVARLHFAH